MKHTQIDHPWDAHGPLRVSENGHYLEHADGTGFFFLGDTAWYLGRLTPQDLDRYMQNRAGRGFNVVLFQVAQHGHPNYAGERVFQGEGPPYAAVTPNEAYWAHVDTMVRTAAAHGLYVCVLPWWGSDANSEKDCLFTDPDQHNYEYGRMLGERYRDEPNVIWVASGEYHKPYFWQKLPLPEQHIARHLRLVEGIRDGDTGQHLMSIHPLSFYSSSDDFHHEEWLDFNMTQSHVLQEYICPLTAADWAMTPPKPTLMSEAWYEGEKSNLGNFSDMRKTEPYDDAWIQRYQAYWAVFHGSIGFVYGHRNLWTMTEEGQGWEDIGDTFPGAAPQAVLDAPGSAQLRHLRALIESKPIQSRVPDQSLLSPRTRGITGLLRTNLRCATRDEDGSWAMVYTTRGRPMQVLVSKLAQGTLNAFWFNPRSGQYHYADDDHADKRPFETGIPSGPGAPDHYFYPPGGHADGNDWVLLLECTCSAHGEKR